MKQQDIEQCRKQYCTNNSQWYSEFSVQDISKKEDDKNNKRSKYDFTISRCCSDDVIANMAGEFFNEFLEEVNIKTLKLEKVIVELG